MGEIDLKGQIKQLTEEITNQKKMFKDQMTIFKDLSDKYLKLKKSIIEQEFGDAKVLDQELKLEKKKTDEKVKVLANMEVSLQ